MHRHDDLAALLLGLHAQGVEYAHLLATVHVDDPHLADAAVHLPGRGLGRLDHVHLDGGGRVLERLLRLGHQARLHLAKRPRSHRLALGQSRARLRARGNSASWLNWLP